MPKLNRQGLASTATRVARVILGSSLLLSILWANVPSALVASGPMCNLACCAGRAPHAAGSCMNGSCHAFLTAQTKAHIHHEAPIEQGEQLCGLSQLRMNFSRLPVFETVTVDFGAEGYADHSHGASKNALDQTSVSTTALTKPCQPDCGTCASGFASSKRQRHAAALGHANGPRPPSGVSLASVDYRPTRKLNALCRRGAPRGPPLPFFA